MERRQHSKTRRFRELLAQGTTVLPGAFNALTARQIEHAGFQALYVSGAGLSASRGLPDIGLLSMTEMVADAKAIADAVTLPTLADADTGFGPPLNVMRTVQEYERAGVAGIQIEDQQDPKRCGHLAGKRLLPPAEMVKKIQAAVKARTDRDFCIVARTDARAIEKLEGAVHRACRYAEAGADAIFPEALESAEEFQTFAERLGKEGITLPLVANMTEFGKSPYLSVKEFEELGYRLVLFPVTALRTAMKAVERVLREIRFKGTQRDCVEQMQTRQELYDLLGYDHYWQLDEE